SSSAIVHVPYEIAYEEGFEDMQRRVPDTTKIRRLTGWRAARSPEAILAAVIDHERASVTARVEA
ncbi:MAG: nucleoside-diphosphate sugar epimerase, partial [Actinobacteria bacterium]|nr:nucleoside-diphosphate sugar epimerase [Actinomycetota bacterium]